jgi:4-aminobutyrate aminotransferase-like enzyme
MGWCSGTEIMDAALKAALAAQRAALVIALDEGHGCCTAEGYYADPGRQVQLDNALRPFVSAVAEVLRDGDWDCIEESDYFDRFPQEMLGDDDQQYEQRLMEQLAEAAEYGDADQVRRVTEQLDAHKRKVEKQA